MAGFQATPRIKNALDNRKLALTVPCPADNTKKSSLGWVLVANNPRMVVYTNDPSDTGADNGYGKITANLDVLVFTAFLTMLEEIISHQGEIKRSIDCLNFIFPQGKRSEKPVLVSTIWLGKDADGIVWISLVAKNRPKIKFTFGSNEFHHFMNGDGTHVPPGKVSEYFAKAYIKTLYGIMEQLLVTLWVEPEKKEFNKGGNSGGGNNWNNQSKQNNNNTDDDIPF